MSISESHGTLKVLLLLLSMPGSGADLLPGIDLLFRPYTRRTGKVNGRKHPFDR